MTSPPLEPPPLRPRSASAPRPIVFLTRRARFSAGHRYYRTEWTPEENERRFGSCARPHGHGHDYLVEATLRGAVDPKTGMVVNMTDVKAALIEAVAPLDGAFLDGDHPLFRDAIPSTENLTRTIHSRLIELIDAEVARLRVYESSALWCETEGGSQVRLTRHYEFSAAHRLHSSELSDDENREIFGKCNHLRGHGHNYGLDVTVAGHVDPLTGFVTDLPKLDATVERLVVSRMDHRHLNFDLPEFERLNPTSENLAVVVWNLLRPEIGTSLAKIGIQETDRNYFEFEGPSPGDADNGLGND